MTQLLSLAKTVLSPTLLVRSACLCVIVMLGALIFVPDFADRVRAGSSNTPMSENPSLNRLLFAIVDCDVPRVRTIIGSRHPNVNVMDNWGTTALIHAIAASMQHKPEMVRVLIENGADVNLPDSTGTTPLTAAVLLQQSDAAALLLKAGADPNARRGDDKSVLHFAIQSDGGLELTQMLLAAGADPNARDACGNKASDVARELENAEIVSVLKDAEAGAARLEASNHPTAIR